MNFFKRLTLLLRRTEVEEQTEDRQANSIACRDIYNEDDLIRVLASVAAETRRQEGRLDKEEM